MKYLQENHLNTVCLSLNAQLEFLAENCVAEYEKEHGEIELSEDELYSK